MMIGHSRQTRELLLRLRRFAQCDAPVLLEGETGTGKELAAREIHYASPRAAKPFVPVNCGAMQDGLIESELFGHRRGAFTDAKTAHAGLVDNADGGTLFLDEVDTLSPKAQVTLLRFLQDREYRPVGGGAMRAADVRMIAASNASLQKLADDGLFRRDLVYRLNTLYVRLTPLRERPDDIMMLAEHFLAAASERFAQPARRWSREALAALLAHDWPGNVRELENVTLRACLDSEASEIGSAELAATDPAFARGKAVDTRPADSFSDAKSSAIESFERRYLTDLMRRAGGNVSVAARLCHIERRQLGKLLKKRGIGKDAFRSGT